MSSDNLVERLPVRGGGLWKLKQDRITSWKVLQDEKVQDETGRGGCFKDPVTVSVDGWWSSISQESLQRGGEGLEVGATISIPRGFFSFGFLTLHLPPFVRFSIHQTSNKAHFPSSVATVMNTLPGVILFYKKGDKR
ncbi:hypothetical protein PROFUN_15677 [Planoprotostelium fungivorum]|uniref:Uncharacterized protein n=1 Tax=Planoprotostelium fungivorum TaxID=1890364 RepID=A0A2P6MV94_9EUKA|nr:hypothetical protein PROFUN_15677 [Planoprotostelium fungivorum]